MAAEPSDIVPARELSRNAATVLDRVEHGERITVTRNGEPVAQIIPIDPTQRMLAKWVREGLIPPAPPGGWATGGDVRSDGPEVPARETGRSLSDLLEEIRERER